MRNNPLDQFEIHKIFPISFFGHDISFTNSSLAMIVAVLSVVLFLSFALKSASIYSPTRKQIFAEKIYNIASDLVGINIGEQGKEFIPLILSIFLFLLACNILGLLPYSFTATSHIAITFTLAMIVFFSVTIVGFIKHGTKFLSLFLPHGIPLWLAPLMIIIELFAFLARPVTLSLRLVANMIAGHVLLKVLAGFMVSLMFLLKPLPLPLIVILCGFELCVALLQAYIFALLSCVYLNDAVNLH